MNQSAVILEASRSRASSSTPRASSSSSQSTSASGAANPQGGDGKNNSSQNGTNFSKKEKQKVIEDNKNKNNGKTVCENCGTETVKSEKSQKGVTPPKNETQVDHITPKSKGGKGQADNGQVLCRDCNRQKSNN
jgi:hypothetical protein